MSKDRIVRTFPIILLLIALLLNGGAAYGYAWSAPGLRVQAGQSPLARQAPHAVGDPVTDFSADPTPTPPPDEDEVTQVSKELYCPLCTGVRVDNCDLPLCDQMREVIRQKLATGETKEEIKAYFVEQYGQVVLGVPPKRGGMILAWVLPFLVVIVAGGWVYHLTRRWTRQQATEEETEAAAPQPLPTEYVERLERELEQFE